MNNNNDNTTKTQVIKPIENEPYQRIKKSPKRPSPKVTDIYVLSKSTSVRTYVKRAQKLIDQQLVPVIHGLGKSIAKAASVATQLQQLYADTLDLEVHTSTEQVMDELDYENEDLEPTTEIRNVSAIHISVTLKPISRLMAQSQTIV